MEKRKRKYTEKDRQRADKYEKENYYRISVVMRKEKRELIEEAAKAAGMSKNAFINSAIDDAINKILG